MLSAKTTTVTIFPLALRLVAAPQNTKNIIRTREKKDNKDFSTNTHRATHSLQGEREKVGNVMYILLLRHCFFPSMLQDTLGRSAPAQCRVVFDQLKKIAKYFFVLPLLKTPTSQQNFSFFLVCRVPRPVPPHSLAHTTNDDGTRRRGRFRSLAELFVGKFGRLQQDLDYSANDPEPFLLHTHHRAFTHDLPELGQDPCAHLQSPSRL